MPCQHSCFSEFFTKLNTCHAIHGSSEASDYASSQKVHTPATGFSCSEPRPSADLLASPSRPEGCESDACLASCCHRCTALRSLPLHRLVRKDLHATCNKNAPEEKPHLQPSPFHMRRAQPIPSPPTRQPRRASHRSSFPPASWRAKYLRCLPASRRLPHRQHPTNPSAPPPPQLPPKAVVLQRATLVPPPASPPPDTPALPPPRVSI